MKEQTVANPTALYLTEADKAIAAKVVDTITQITQVNTIFVLAKKLNTAQNIFVPPGASAAHTSAFWLLVLITGDDKRLKMYQEAMEQNCSLYHTVSCMVMQTSSFVRELYNKNTFAATVVLNAPVIYNTSPQLEQWRKDVLAESASPTGQTGFLKCVTLFNEYMAGAQLFTVRKHYKLALFMYHQATELVLTAFIKSQTGLQLRIHNIHHLNQYLSFLAPQIAAGFGGITQKERDTFRLLQKSYCAARYEEGFEVGFKELEIVREKVSALISWLRAGIEVV